MNNIPHDELDIAPDEMERINEAIDELADDAKSHLKAPAALLETRKIIKTFKQGGNALNVLNGINMQIDSGEIVALVGPSGSGKSTLLQILGLLDQPTSGKLRIAGNRAEDLNDRARTDLRRDEIGFVYQFHHLLPEFSALENVAMPQVISGVRKKRAHEKAAHLLETLGLGQRLDHRPAKLSGGEQQRVAIARALVNDPKILLADEPTGNLDPDTSENVFNLLLDIVRNRNICALIATHNIDLSEQMDRVLELKSGKIMTL